MDFFAGIDGGGTKTRVIIQSLDCSVELTEEFSAFNFNSIGEKAFRTLLDKIIAFIERQGNCISLCLGAAGVSNQNMCEIIGERLSASRIPNWKLVGDHVIAHYGALNGRNGIILIAGTGAIAYGRNDGQEARSGGWGHIIGDGGSGYAIARDSFAHLAKVYDGYGKPTMLKELFAREYDLSSRDKIIAYVYKGDKSAVAALSPLVEKAYWAGDEVASDIIRRNAKDLADNCICVADKLGLESGYIATLGGLLSHETCMRVEFEKLLKALRPGFECVYPLNNALNGALILAKETAGEKS